MSYCFEVELLGRLDMEKISSSCSEVRYVLYDLAYDENAENLNSGHMFSVTGLRFVEHLEKSNNENALDYFEAIIMAIKKSKTPDEETVYIRIETPF